MKSPILLIFFFAITYCLNICDGADDKGYEEIGTLKDKVENYTQSLTAFVKEEPIAIEVELNGMKAILEETMNEIVRLSVQKWQKAAKSERADHCIEPAIQNLKTVKTELINEFDDLIKKEQQLDIKLDKNFIVGGKFLIARCNSYLASRGNKDFREAIKRDFQRFETKVATEKSVIDSAVSSAREICEARAEKLKGDLNGIINKMESDIKNCKHSTAS